MFDMVRHTLRQHRYKIAVGVPIAFLLASSLSLVRSSEEVCIVPDDNRYVQVNETVTLHVLADTTEPVNVIGATIVIPTDQVEVEAISRENSIIDLWAEEPMLSEDGSEVHFSGGILTSTGFLGGGRVLTIVVRPIAEGQADIRFKEVHMLAHDGTGMEVACGNGPILLSIRPETYPSPDVNGDKVVNLFDFGIVSARLFMTYERTYDLNLDGKVTIADIAVLISNMGSSNGHLASLAFNWTR